MVVPKKNGKLQNLYWLQKFNGATKKDSYPLPSTNEVLNIIVGHKVYSFLDGFFWIPSNFYYT